ncbi:MAG TPA: ATP-binding cassette domain-containing protein [Acidimicrobiales bacterium]|nr:ATP-binding cassette domain-containing protein [Acidimicrobiales bacterium]
MTISIEILVIGVLTGLTYAVLAAGIIVVYRACKVINFAHGEMGAFGAAILAKLVLDLHWNWFVAFVFALAVGAALGAIVERTVIRRLASAPRLVLLVATIGISQLLFYATALLPGIDNLARYPSGIHRVARIGDFLLRGEHFMVMAFVPAVAVALTLYLTKTPHGRALRASAENPDAARLAGVDVDRVSALVWVVAGVLSTATFILINPIRGTIVGAASVALGPSLMLRGLVAALAGGLVSIPVAMGAGAAVGVVEAVLFANVDNPGIVDGVLFAAVLVLVLARGRELAGGGEDSLSLAPVVQPVPANLAERAWIRRLPLITSATALGIAIFLPILFSSSAQQFLFSRVVIFAIIGISMTVLTGWAGQLSLGQFAFVGLGAFVTYALVSRGMPYGAALGYAIVAGTSAALLIGAPALRIRGLALAATTLAFAVAARAFILPSGILTGGGERVFLPRDKFWFVDIASPRSFYYVALAALVASALIVSRLRASGIGRSIIAARENADAAAAFTVSPARAKLTAFALSGGLAALAGALLGAAQVQFSPSVFEPTESLHIIGMVVIGGLGSVAGALLGAVYVLGVPALFGDTQSVRLLTSGAGILVVLLVRPGGLVQVAYQVRDAALGLLATRVDAAAPAHARGGGDLDAVADARSVRVSAGLADMRGRLNGSAKGAGERALSTEAISVSFGGIVALDGVSIHATRGESVGLIGSNGAGKSTLMNVISGFQPALGRVEIFGNNCSALPAHARAQLGVGRVFQDARLFGELEVWESVAVALEARARSEFIPSALWLPPARRAEAQRRAEADDLISYLGLGRYARERIANLSTGTRRVAELACLLALAPRLILLDEPTAGVAQRETEAFEPLLRGIQRELDATLVIIEHDMPLIMALSDRVYCMAAGQVIAIGAPNDVRRDPKVIAAYLGTDERAIMRSDKRRAPRAKTAKPNSVAKRPRKQTVK